MGDGCEALPSSAEAIRQGAGWSKPTASPSRWPPRPAPPSVKHTPRGIRDQGGESPGGIPPRVSAPSVAPPPGRNVGTPPKEVARVTALDAVAWAKGFRPGEGLETVPRRCERPAESQHSPPVESLTTGRIGGKHGSDRFTVGDPRWRRWRTIVLFGAPPLPRRRIERSCYFNPTCASRRATRTASSRT